MKNFCIILYLCGLVLLSGQSSAQQMNVDALTYSGDGQQSSMVFVVKELANHRLFLLEKPSRLVIDLKNTKLDKSLAQPPANHPLFAKARAASKNATDLRIVVDLKQDIPPQLLKLSSHSEARQLVVSLANLQVSAAKQPDKPKTEIAKERPAVAESKHNKANKQVAEADTPLIIAIDAGHGGDDPGAQGVNGTQEKIVTLSIANKLAALVNAQPGLKAVLVRKGDYYVGLRGRIDIAREAKADLFISIHADAFQDASVRGASVYTLSRDGASDEAAEWLANKENSADLIGGISLNDKEKDLAHVLLDLSQTATLEASSEVAGKVLKSFAGVSELHKNTVQKAGFIVLKSPDIPSILVETAFISNPLEEQNLISERYQDKMANAIFKGIYNYFKHSIPVNNRVAKL